LIFNAGFKKVLLPEENLLGYIGDFWLLLTVSCVFLMIGDFDLFCCNLEIGLALFTTLFFIATIALLNLFIFPSPDPSNP
jgi:hypothetical protein